MKNSFKNLQFNTNDKTFDILHGSKGKYDYTKIKKCSLKCEDAQYKGKSEPFSHQVLTGMFNYSMMHPGLLFVGIIFTLKNDEKIYLYITDNAVQLNSIAFHEDMNEGKEIVDFTNKIIKKYQQE